jgi:hypothetical protein
MEVGGSMRWMKIISVSRIEKYRNLEQDFDAALSQLYWCARIQVRGKD